MASSPTDFQYGADATISTIADATIACRVGLELCMDIEVLKSQGWAENRLADFNVWDSGLGASSNRRASLEDRLASKPQVRTVVSNLLVLYKYSIDMCREIGLLHGKRGGSNHDDNEKITVDDTTLPEAIENADLVLNDLAGLAVLIRKAGTTSRLITADNTFKPGAREHDELRYHLYQLVLCQAPELECRRHEHWNSIEPRLIETSSGKNDDFWARVDKDTISFLYDDRKITEVQLRLVEANLKRAHRFAYSRKHGMKLERLSQQPEALANSDLQEERSSDIDNASVNKNLPLGPMMDGSDKGNRSSNNQPVSLEHEAGTFTETAASKLDTEIIRDATKPPTPSQQAVTEISTTGSRLRYPRPPRCEEGATLFTCPCCCLPLPISHAEPRRWRKHLKEDILPYTCVLPRCSNPHQMFLEKVTWLEHMFNDHVGSTSWQCDICDGSEVFPHAADFEMHLKTTHLGAIPASQLAILVDLGVRKTAAEISSCPLCNWAQDIEGVVSNDLLLEHVAEHIHSFALRSLPWAPDQSENINQADQESALEKVERWLKKCYPGLASVEDKPSRQPMVVAKNQSEYFIRHKYFAESSIASSLALTRSSIRSDSSENVSSIASRPDTDSLMDATEMAIEDLASTIGKASCTNSKNEVFLPVDKIAGFVEAERIRRVVRHTQFFDNMENLVRFVQEDAQRLFLTLVMMESNALEEELIYFQDVGFDDSVLPIRVDKRNRSAYSLLDPSSDTRYPFPAKWKRTQIALFEEYHRQLTAPVFGSPDTFYSLIPEGQRLPYLEVAPIPKISGYFGEVSRNIIHAKHIHPSIELPVMVWTRKDPMRGEQPIQVDAIAVAVKKTKEGDDDPQYSRAEFFDKELGNLKRLREYDLPHLIKPICGYQNGQDRCLMFPWAEGGNLGGYWKEFPLQARNRSHVLWQFRQFVGICSALKELHNRNVRHGDLKPENILWFEPKNNGGTLQIADLGLATFHKKEQDTNDHQGMPTQIPPGTSRYEPPEMDGKRNSQDPRSRQYDIWSLGCIVFELLLWLAYDPSDITIFRENTPYFWQKHHRRGKNEYVVHEYVVAIMETLDRDLEPGTAYKDLLDFVRNRLLVIKYSANYNDVPDDCREGATKVYQDLATIVQRCESNSDYLKPLTEKLRYPEAELDGKATHRNGVPRNEVYEKGGYLAVPGQHSNVQHALHSNEMLEDIAQITQSGISDPDQVIPRLPLRAATMNLNSGSLTPQTSQVSNHQEDVSSYDAREES